MNDLDSMPSKCHDCQYWEMCKYPYVCPTHEAPQSEESEVTEEPTEE